MRTDSHIRPPQSWHAHAADAGPWIEPDQKAKLLHDWQLVKRARFHAADRLERRGSASLITLSMVALYGGLITVFVLIFKDSLSAHGRNVLDWMSVVANWLTLTSRADLHRARPALRCDRNPRRVSRRAPR